MGGGGGGGGGWVGGWVGVGVLGRGGGGETGGGWNGEGGEGGNNFLDLYLSPRHLDGVNPQNRVPSWVIIVTSSPFRAEQD